MRETIIFMMTSLFTANVFAGTIEVFTTGHMPVALQGMRADVCELDSLQGLDCTINKGNDFERLISRTSKDCSQKIRDFYQCQYQANLYDLTLLPAIVVDKTYVVYGKTALDKALLLVRHEEGRKHD